MPRTTKSKPTPATYGHERSSRKNLPSEQTAEQVDPDTLEPRAFEPDIRDQDDQPRLNWQRARRDSDERHESYPMFVREKLHPGHFATWLQEGQKDEEQQTESLFRADFNGLPTEDSKYEWYQHDANWSNRIIHGESAQVMTSLLEREQMAGQVQMIYMDPPYGMNYNSNFQVDATNTNVGSKREDIGDVQTVRAFRDSYERGIHSYLDQLLVQLRLCRDLLADTGSMFFQIGDDNVHNIAKLLDEVFGAENRVATIPYATSGGSSSRVMPSVADFLLWYAKDRDAMRFSHLYEEADQVEKVSLASSYLAAELRSGQTVRVSSAERRQMLDGVSPFPGGTRFCTLTPVTSQGEAGLPTGDEAKGRSEPYVLPAENALEDEAHSRSIACPKGRQWSVSHEGLDQLHKKARLVIPEPGSSNEMRWKLYFDEMPGKRLNNIWADQAAENNKRYVVQTAEKVIRRAMLMTTEPGDLVFDPTCGSGTTAKVAEEWGRRWITCDTAPTCVTLARQRVATGAYPYWALRGTREGYEAEAEITKRLRDELNLNAEPEFNLDGDSHDPSAGFVYERVPYVSARTLAYDLPQTYTYLVDQPAKVKGKVRLASPFTVESTAGAGFQPFKQVGTGSRHADSRRNADFAERVREYLESDGVTDSISAQPITFNSLTPMHATSHLAYHVTYEQNGETGEGAVMLAPPDAVVPRDAIRKAGREVAQHVAPDATLFVVAYEAETGSQRHDKPRNVANVPVVHVRPHRDLMLELTSVKGYRAFTALAEPDIAIHRSDDGDGRIEVELRGFDTYDPATGETQHLAAEKDVSCWMIDTNFDGTSFFADRLHFPAGGENDLRKLARALKVKPDSLRYQATLSNRSASFVVGKNNAIAVRVVTRTGDEMTHEIEAPASVTQ